MRLSVLARGRVLTGCAFAALTAALLSACGTSGGNSSVTIGGKVLTIYSSVPAKALNLIQAQDVYDAEQLALKQSGSQIAGFSVSLAPALTGNDLDGKPGSTLARQITNNARAAISNTHAIAYLAETDPGQSGYSIPITNDEDLLQVSPTDTALEYTQKTAAVPASPDVYYDEGNSSYGHTFARIAPNSGLEAQAQAQQLHSSGVQKLYVTSDGSDYGAAIAAEVVKQAKNQGLTVTTGAATATAANAAGADAVFIGATDPAGAAQLTNAVTAKAIAVPSALATSSFLSALTSDTQKKVSVSTPGYAAGALPPKAQKFESDFKAAYGHAPASGAIFGYEAMITVLDALRAAGSGANNRTTVIKDYRNITVPANSVLGSYSINGGDPKNGLFVFNSVSGGTLKPLSSPAQG